MAAAKGVGQVSEQLKPCPFCGGDAGVGKGFGYWFVNCTDCMASTNIVLGDSLMPTEAEAIAAWNKRTPQDASHLTDDELLAMFAGEALR